MVDASELRPGRVIRIEGELYKVLAANYHAGGGKMAGVTHTKLRNLNTGTLRELRFRAGEGVEAVEMELQTMQYLYGDGATSFFMNVETFEQVGMDNQRLGEVARYLKEGMTLPVEFVDGQPVSVVFPEVVEVAVAETAPPTHSQTSDNVWKEATLENGVTVMVPLFIAPGEIIRVEVETGKYVERAKGEKKEKK